MAATRSILELQKSFNNIFSPKNISISVYLLNFYSSLSGFWLISRNMILRSYSLPRYVEKWQIYTYLGREYERDIAFLEITQKPLKLE